MIPKVTRRTIAISPWNPPGEAAVELGIDEHDFANAHQAND